MALQGSGQLMVENNEDIQWLQLLVIILGTFIAILTSSTVNVALPTMMTVFGVSASDAQWVLTSYMLTMGVVIPMAGYLGDNFGYKRVYFLALLFFITGSMLCGISWNIPTMIVARVIQAVGGGIMQPLGMAIVYRSAPRSKIGLVLGVWGIAAMAAPAIGPTVGGYIVEYVNWRVIFYLNVPIGILDLFLASMLLTETQLIKAKKFDFNGLILCGVGLFCLLLALAKGNNKGWSSAYIVSLFTIAALSLLIMLYHELRADDPILELRILKDPIFTLSLIIGSVLSIGMYGAIFLVPILLQNVLGQSALTSGLILLPAGVAMALMMPVSGRVFDRFGSRGVTIVGVAMVIIGTWLFAHVNQNTPFRYMTIVLAVRGMGIGLSMMPSNTAGMMNIPAYLVGKASSMSNMFRQVAACFGVAMFTTIMQNRQAFHLAMLAQSINISSDDYAHLQEALKRIGLEWGLKSDTVQYLGTNLLYQKVSQLSMIGAINDCFLIASAICVLGLFLAFFLKKSSQPGSTTRA